MPAEMKRFWRVNPDWGMPKEPRMLSFWVEMSDLEEVDASTLAPRADSQVKGNGTPR